MLFKKNSERILLVLCRKVSKKVENHRSCTLKDLGGCYVRRYVNPAGCSFCFHESHSTVPVLTVLYGQTCCWFHQHYFSHYTAFLCNYLFSQQWVSKLYVFFCFFLALQHGCRPIKLYRFCYVIVLTIFQSIKLLCVLRLHSVVFLQ